MNISIMVNSKGRKSNLFFTHGFGVFFVGEGIIAQPNNLTPGKCFFIPAGISKYAL